MSAKLGYEAIEFAIRKWMTENTKGIATIPGQKMKDKIKILMDKYAKQIRMTGKDVNKVTVKEVENAIDYGMALTKQQKPKVISQRDPEFQGITEKLLGKNATVHPFTGAGKLRIQQDVDGIIKNLKTMEPVDAMKEANSVIGRKGKYRHLSNDEAERIVAETEDHIFQREVDDLSPDDFASGGIAGELHLNRPGYSKGKVVTEGLEWLAKLLKGGGKKEDLYKHIDMEKLMKGKDKIKVYSGTMDRPSNTWKSFKESAKDFGITPEKYAKDQFKGQWFTPFKRYADSFSSPEYLHSKMRSVDLTPEEIGMAKRYVEKINKKDMLVSMRRKLDIKPYPKHHVTTDENLVLIPRYKLKELEKTKRMKTDYMILEKLKKKIGLAQGGLAHVLGV